MRVSIVGTGYVGLVTGACLAERGHSVVCVDVDRRKVDMINGGEAPIHELDLPDLLKRNVGSRLSASTDLAKAVAGSEITFIAVGTPAVDGRIDLRYVEQAAAEVGAALKTKSEYHALIVKSTVIPGTTDGAVRTQAERASGKRAGADFGLGMNPEFLTEGTAVKDFMFPDRIVLGGIDDRTRELLGRLYTSFESAPRVLTNNRTAEMIKYASNSLLATMISFSNEIGRLCSKIGGVDVADVMRGVHQSAYFTKHTAGGEKVVAPITSFLEAGCGFGGSCLPKDVTALVAQGIDQGLGMPLLKSVLEINRGQPAELMRLLAKHFPDLNGVRVAVLGIAFKPDTDDIRESPAFPVLRQLRAAGAKLVAYDPIARPADHADLKGVRLATSLQDAVGDAQAVVLVTRWPEFGELARVLAERGASPVVIDGRRMLAPAAFKHYEGIGR